PCAQILDQATTESPMAGIAAALQACTSAWVLIVAADMPFVSADLLHAMAKERQHYQAVVPYSDGRYQTLCAFYHQSCLATFEDCLFKKQYRLQALMQRLNTQCLDEVWLKQHDPSLLSFFDLDTQADVHQAKQIMNHRKKS
ncbi:MAG: molybdenum cofactor guanylyltransferase, partial [Mariprofundaceae bacterium]|nr:molybdenum cofactor guanylyltransferase [Mariprofundaceae bacterium]